VVLVDSGSCGGCHPHCHHHYHRPPRRRCYCPGPVAEECPAWATGSCC
jgi:hypothetical protein